MSDVQATKRFKCCIREGSSTVKRLDIDPLAPQFDAVAGGAVTTRSNKFFILTVQLGRFKFLAERQFSTKSQAVNAAVHVCDALGGFPEFV